MVKVYLSRKGIPFTEYNVSTDQDALKAFHRLSQLEGIIPALESAHAIAYVLDFGAKYRDEGPVVVCLSGRGDKDVSHVAQIEGSEPLI